MTNFKMQDIYKKLKPIGLTKEDINQLMPDWWLENGAEIIKTESGFQETLWRIANNHSIDFSSLLDSFSNNSQTPKFIFGNHLFKHSKNLNETKLQPAVSVAMFVAKNTMRVYEKPLANLNGLTALSIREQLLQNAKWVDFETLLNYTWSLGIPVIFVNNLPKNKMDGLALKIQDRPVIVLTKKEKYGFLAFHLAHELGHIVLGHLNQNTMIVDEKISANDTETERFEQEADEFALELLTGYKDSKFTTDKSYSQMNRLCQSIIKLANEHNIDPLHITLNYGYSNSNFPLARKLLSLIIKQLDIKKTDIDNAYQYYIKNIDLNSFADEEVILNIIEKAKK